ncbi:MAG: GNAT family N-acetyltransferase [Sphingobacteriales bacterium]|nr:MAG: GNAT family N-acetyltransferase [Sphingobacteriales bacterium]
MSQDITTRIIDTTDAIYPQVYELREEILRKPIGLSLKDEDLSGDAKDDIVIAEQDGKVLGCIMLKKTDDASVVKFRQMAVQQNLQRSGVGKKIMGAAEEQAWLTGHSKISLHARTSAEDFYKKRGYATTGDVFTEVGIPHVVMEKHKPHGL